jgi:hypothetical protein
LLSSRHRSLGALLIAGALLLAACGGDDGDGSGSNAPYKAPSAAKKKEAIGTAGTLYIIATRYSDLDISSGPCIGDKLPELGPGWVVDIVHVPRRPSDDLPRNLCPKTREGRARHIVELDPSGKVVRVR